MLEVIMDKIAPVQLQAFSVIDAIDATTLFVVVKTMAAAEAAAAASPPAAASLYQAFQVDTKGLTWKGGHCVHDNFKHLASNPDA